MTKPGPSQELFVGSRLKMPVVSRLCSQVVRGERKYVAKGRGSKSQSPSSKWTIVAACDCQALQSESRCRRGYCEATAWDHRTNYTPE